MEQKLRIIVGRHVRIVNETDADAISAHVRIHAHGRLEGPDDDGEFYVRIGDDPAGHGCNGIGFAPENVAEVFHQPSGIHEITLKG